MKVTHKQKTFLHQPLFLLFLIFGFLRQGFCVSLSWNSLCRPGCLWTHRDPPASASSAGIKGVCYHTLNSQRSVYLCLPSIGIKAVYRHTQLLSFYLFFIFRTSTFSLHIFLTHIYSKTYIFTTFRGFLHL